MFAEVEEASGGRAKWKEGTEAVAIVRLFCHVLWPSWTVSPHPQRNRTKDHHALKPWAWLAKANLFPYEVDCLGYFVTVTKTRQTNMAATEIK